MVLVDGGVENFNSAVDAVIESGLLKRVLAQTEIRFSNSLIESEGLSWAEIRPDGKWVIETVRRKFAADEVAALVINENHPVPNRTRSLERIRYLAITVKALIGTEEFGKL